MTFIRAEIPQCPAYGFEVAPEFSTDIANLQSGREKRNALWSIVRHRFSVPYRNIPLENYRDIKAMFYVCRGRLNTFMQKDWTDYQAEAEVFGVGDGVTKRFKFRKISTKDGVSYERPISVVEGVTTYLNGVAETNVTIEEDTGWAEYDDAPGVGVILTWDGEFFVKVRFDTDSLPFNYADPDAMVGSLDLIEVMDE